MRNRFFILGIGLFGLAACGRACGKSSPTLALEDAAAKLPIRDAAAREAPLVDLLRWTDARVAVSSRVDNPHDHPEHLLDGDPATAWNGRTGDLVGGYIAFAVPADADVVTVLLSVGFDKVSKTGEDLFAENYRIERVRILRDGVTLREVTLDVTKREPQPIAVGTKGGTFRIEVLTVQPGTKKAWRELAVSELVVLGRPGAERRTTPRVPDVKVGALTPAITPEGGAADDRGQIPFPSVDAFCTYHAKRVESALTGAHYGVESTPYCTPDQDGATTLQGSPFRRVRTATIWDERANQRARVALVEAAAGFYETPVRIALEPSYFETCGPTLSRAEWLDPPQEYVEMPATPGLLLAVVAASANSGYSTENETVPSLLSYERRVTACKLAADILICTDRPSTSQQGNYADVPAMGAPWPKPELAWPPRK